MASTKRVYAPNKDLTGLRFGKLRVLSYTPQYTRVSAQNRKECWRGAWLCLCDCGNQIHRYTSDLKSGYGNSCGCGRQDRYKILIGKRFGLLRVVSFDKIRKDQRMWKCLCDCGQDKSVSTHHLTSGKVKSCGCALIQARRKPRNLKKKQTEYDQLLAFFASIDVEVLTSFEEFIKGRRREKPIRLRNLENGMEYSRRLGTIRKSMQNIEEHREKKAELDRKKAQSILPQGVS